MLNRDKLVPLIIVKPAMTEEKRNIESLLLRKRWNLIQNGMDCKQIKIYNNRIYVNKKLHGEVKDSKSHHSDSLIRECSATTEHELQTTQTSSQGTTSGNNNNLIQFSSKNVDDAASIQLHNDPPSQ